MSRSFTIRSVGWLCFLGLAASAGAALSLPHVIDSNMVLQRDQPVPIWGWATPRAPVTVVFAGQTRRATADANGRWQARLRRLATANVPATMTISGDGSVITLTNLLVGEVWLCSGQSNMEKPIGLQHGQKPVAHFEAELATGDAYPDIRLFKAQRVMAATPAADVAGTWTVCSSNSLDALKFSAAAYFFARKLHQELGVPIGLVESAWGGTRVEPWTPPEGFRSVPAVASLAGFSPGTNKLVNTMPGVLYNGMIAPLKPFALRGVLWYQGESNCMDVNDGDTYAAKFEALIRGWRKLWGQGNFPFYYVQLAPYSYYSNRPTPRVVSPEELPEIWEAQTHCLRLPHTGMAVITDTVSNLKDIHPTDKQDVGLRLALLALNRTYGQKKVVCTGPLFDGARIQSDRIVVRFRGTDGGLVARDGQPLNSFTIGGADGRFVPADARIDGDSVVVSSPAVASPQAVRFGWHELAQPNLANGAGLPASSFRTDNPWAKKGGW
jgi:sialate O-acetylesterase